ncbi:hypothetical protein D3C86_2259230 [compost metagenome]
MFYDDNFSGLSGIAAVDTPGPGTYYYAVSSAVSTGLAGFTFAAGGHLIIDEFKDQR